MSTMSSLRYVLRSLAKARGFTLVAAVTLALGIGANGAVFSVVDAVLLRPLPYPDSDQIVLLDADSAQPFVRYRADVGFEVFPRQLMESHAFVSVGIAESGGLNLGAERPVRVRASRVSPEFFRTLDAKPVVGRFFTAEDLAQTGYLAVLGHALWRRRFGEDPSVVGRTIQLNNRAVLVTGVMPPRVRFPDQSEVWVSARSRWQLDGAAAKPLVLARLAPGMSLSLALDELNRIDEEFGATRENRRLVPLREVLVGHIQPALAVIAMGSFFVLLVGSINVGNLLFARIMARQQEMAVRRVLGASRMRLAADMLVESSVISVIGGGMAIPLALGTLAGLRLIVPVALHADAIEMNARVFLSLAAASAVSFLLVAAFPMASFRDQFSPYSQGIFSPLHHRVRSILVTAQVAVALVLLASAVTIMGTLEELLRTDLGASGAGALVVRVTLPQESYDSREDIWQFYQRLLVDFSGLPGVVAAGVSDQIPGDPTSLLPGRPINLDGTDASNAAGFAIFSCATPNYFKALGIVLLAGRPFSENDQLASHRAAIVSEGFAHKFNMSPNEIIGRQTNTARMMAAPEFREIIGVVRDVRHHGPENSFSPSVYVPCADQPPHGAANIVVKAEAEPVEVVAALRRAAARIDPHLPLYDVRSFDDIRASYLADRQFVMRSTTIFGGLSFVLATVGLYGVLNYLVQLRKKEIGVRLALGAPPSRVRRDVLFSGMLHAGVGVIAGTACTVALTRLAWANIVGLAEIDAKSLLSLAFAVSSVALLASWFPALRATSIDPGDTLRFE